LEFSHAESFGKILEEDLDEDTAAAGCFFFVEMDYGEDVPAYGVGAEHVAEEAGDVSETICFVAVDCIIVFGERCFE
jgi:hypothetical protein